MGWMAEAVSRGRVSVWLGIIGAVSVAIVGGIYGFLSEGAIVGIITGSSIGGVIDVTNGRKKKEE